MGHGFVNGVVIILYGQSLIKLRDHLGVSFLSVRLVLDCTEESSNCILCFVFM
jgi:hypothetical protein